jgi:hypothetical protein
MAIPREGAGSARSLHPIRICGESTWLSPTRMPLGSLTKK